MTIPRIPGGVDPMTMAFDDPLGLEGTGTATVPGEDDLTMDRAMDAAMADAMAIGEMGDDATEPTTFDPNAAVAPNTPDPVLAQVHDAESVMRALYGSDFPLAQGTDITPAMWAAWVRARWVSRLPAVQHHLHLVERNRLMRAGIQWISSRGTGPWHEPSRQKDAVRAVYNMIDKALDQRLQILMDQKPGFSVTPMTQDPDDRRKAQAQQLALEYQHEQQGMMSVMREAEFWAQTDGVAFVHQFWDPDRGPWDERMGDGQRKAPLGDVGRQVLRVEQVRVSSNATANQPPHWVVIRDMISREEAVYRYGAAGLDGADMSTLTGQQPAYNGADGMGAWVLTQTTVGEGQRLRDEAVTERFTVYIAPNAETLPNGLHMIVIGDAVVFGPTDLLWGVIPITPVRDGSSDPSYYPRPVMEQWLDHQIRVNALLSKWVENVRVNSGGRFLTRPNAIATETFMGGVTSMIEIRGAGPMGDSIQPVQGFSVGNDVKEMLALEKTAFENASGWNAVSRGQVTGESGRAIIASREQLERVFSPAVNALALAYTEWAKVALAAMAWGYSLPRSLGAIGKGRPDLAAAITQTDFDGQSDVKVEPATLMPMPLAFRMYLLDNWLQTGVIDMKEYRRRQMFAMARDISTPDEDQEARAKRVAEAIRTGGTVPPMRWQDNEAIHQDVLDREILLQDDLDETIIQAASQRWIELANQAAQKSGQMAGPSMPGQGGGPPAASVPALPANQMPLAQTNPPIGVTNMVTPGGVPEAEQTAQMADLLSRQA